MQWAVLDAKKKIECIVVEAAIVSFSLFLYLELLLGAFFFGILGFKTYAVSKIIFGKHMLTI